MKVAGRNALARPLHRRPSRSRIWTPCARQHGPVAVLEIGDLVGEGRERDGVGTEIHLALAVADRERRPVPGADEQVLLAGEEEGEREGAAQPRQGRRDRLHRALALAHLARDELRHDLGVGLGLEAHALGAELVLELAEILDDAVVDDGELLGRVRVGVASRSGRPWVAQRVWPMPIAPASGAFESLTSRLPSLPSARRRSSRPPSSSVAMPAES